MADQDDCHQANTITSAPTSTVQQQGFGFASFCSSTVRLLRWFRCAVLPLQNSECAGIIANPGARYAEIVLRTGLGEPSEGPGCLGKYARPIQ